MIFMPEPFRHTSWIYLASLAGVSMLQGRPQSLTTLEGASAGLRSVKRGVCVVCVCRLVRYRIDTTRLRGQGHNAKVLSWGVLNRRLLSVLLFNSRDLMHSKCYGWSLKILSISCIFIHTQIQINTTINKWIFGIVSIFRCQLCLYLNTT